MGNVAPLRSDLRAYPAFGVKGGDMPEPDLVAAHLEYLMLRGLSAQTVYQRQRALARLAAVLGPVPLAGATPAGLMAWRRGAAGGPGAGPRPLCPRPHILGPGR